MRGRHSYQGMTVAVASGVIVLATALLSVIGYRYAVGRENLAETMLFQSEVDLAGQFIDRIEQKLIDNDLVLEKMTQVQEPAKWPAMVEEIMAADLNVEQVYICRPRVQSPLYPPYSHEIRNSWGAFHESFRVREIQTENLVPDQPYHLHQERANNYFFATYILKKDAKGNAFLICYQMNFLKIIALLDRYLRDLQANFYVSVVDYDNNGVYKEPIARSPYYYETRFPSTLYKWILQIVPRNYTEIERNARNQRRWGLFLIILSNGLILASVAVIFAAARRERQLRQLKEDFISSVSHELKTPLSLISMFSELLKTDRIRSEQSRREYYDIIHGESVRMNALVKNLLDFASLERGERARHFEMTNVATLVSREIEAFEHQAARASIRIRSEVEGTVPETFADPTAISMALLNFLDNSVKFAGQNPEIRVRVARGNGAIDLSVSDNGPGIPPEEQGKVFEKFYRGSNAVDRKIRGSGIGLAIARHVADLHGGQVFLESAEGKGSTFTLRIPLRSAPEKTPPAAG